MNPLHNSLPITTNACLVKKSSFFLELAQLVLRQNELFFPQAIVVSLRKRVIQ
jgi:hypothetical protein